MIHKNFETVCQAFSLLKQRGFDAKVIITLDGSENKYARKIYDSYHAQDNVLFSGTLDRKQMADHYNRCDGVVFLSKIESWGLPVSEAKEFGKPIFVSDLPYAKETVGEYDRAKFIDPEDPDALARAIGVFISGRIDYDPTKPTYYKPPFARSWEELIALILPS